MSLETLIANLTAAVEANTAAVLGKASTGKAAAKDDDAGEATTTRRRRSSAKDEDAGDSKKSKYTAEQVKAAAVKVKEELGTKVAKQLISDHGAEELAKLKPENYDAFVEACERELNGDDDGKGKDDDGGL